MNNPYFANTNTNEPGLRAWQSQNSKQTVASVLNQPMIYRQNDEKDVGKNNCFRS